MACRPRMDERIRPSDERAHDIRHALATVATFYFYHIYIKYLLCLHLHQGNTTLMNQHSGRSLVCNSFPQISNGRYVNYDITAAIFTGLVLKYYFYIYFI